MFPCGPLFVMLVKLVGPAVAFAVTQTLPPAGEERDPLSGPSPLVVAYMTSDPLLSVGPPAARACTRFTSVPAQVPEPRVSKFGLSTAYAPPARGPRQTRQ